MYESEVKCKGKAVVLKEDGGKWSCASLFLKDYKCHAHRTPVQKCGFASQKEALEYAKTHVR